MNIDNVTQKNVIDDYLNTKLKVFEIADKYNLCRQSIRNIILKNNLKLRENKINLEIIKNIINDYNNGITNKKIAEKYTIHRSVVQQILIKNGIKLRQKSETSRKHIITNENYFNLIDTEEKGYVLGLLFSDGYINKNGFGISLIDTDKELLEKISNIIYNKVVLGVKKERKYSEKLNYFCKQQYRFEVVSNIMKNDLIKHGCVQQKTFKIRFPHLINENIYRGFVRGYFDGDGCLCIPTKNSNNVTVTMTSNTKFCDEIAEYIKNNVNVNMKSCVRYKDVGNIRLTGKKQVIKFMNWLYKDSTIHMKRKYDKYQNFLITHN